MYQSISVKVYKSDSSDSDEYALLDSGDKLKLERVGDIVMVRSEPRAWWRPRLPKAEWGKAVALYEKENKKEWIFKKKIPREFTTSFEGLIVKLRFLQSSKHIGIFPEQAETWVWMRDRIRACTDKKNVRVLNVFGYTGIASLIAAKEGAQVTHLDGSKMSIAWAWENQALSGLSDAPIRSILDDAMNFVKREVKRGNRYEGIILDPPSFGRGPKGQVWKAEEDLPAFLAFLRELFSDTPLFFILNMYSTELSALSLENLMADAMKGLSGATEVGELGIQEYHGDRVLPLSIFARWRAGNH